MRRARRAPASDPDIRMQQRMGAVEAKPQPWRSMRSDDGGPLRIIRGDVDTGGSGTILRGGGFTITRGGAGNITVTFTTPFSAAPTVVTSSQTTGAVNSRTGHAAPAAGSVQIFATDSAGVAADQIVTFIIIGLI